MGFYIGTGKASRRREGFIANPRLHLLEPVSEGMRFKAGTEYYNLINRLLYEMVNGSKP
jgi:hypothetical protein